MKDAANEHSFDFRPYPGTYDSDLSFPLVVVRRQDDPFTINEISGLLMAGNPRIDLLRSYHEVIVWGGDHFSWMDISFLTENQKEVAKKRTSDHSVGHSDHRGIRYLEIAAGYGGAGVKSLDLRDPQR